MSVQPSDRLLPTLGYTSDCIALRSDFTPPISAQQYTDLLLVSEDGQSYLLRDLGSEPNNEINNGVTLYALRQTVSFVKADYFDLFCRGYQLLESSKNQRFCSRCGEHTHSHPSDAFAQTCPQCSYTQYPRVQPCVIVAITRGKEILLAQAISRKNTMYSLLAGYVEVGETLEHAVAREVFEEVGITINNIRYVKSQPWPYPTNIMIGFTAEYAGGEFKLQADEIFSADFFPFNALPSPLPISGSLASELIRLVTQCGTTS